MTAALSIDDVTKRYGTGPAVIDGLSHTFAPGTLSLFVGPNGAGKTTLLRLLAVLAYPTSGTVRYGDLDIHARPHRYLSHVGVVHAGGELPAHLTATELLEWLLRSRGEWGEDGPDRIATLLDRLHLDERRANRIGTYSSGMAQKTQIAAAFVAEPRVLLMDEPLRSLDAATTEATVELIEDFVGDGGLAVVASHRTDALVSRADETLHLGADVPGAEAKAA